MKALHYNAPLWVVLRIRKGLLRDSGATNLNEFMCRVVRRYPTRILSVDLLRFLQQHDLCRRYRTAPHWLDAAFQQVAFSGIGYVEQVCEDEAPSREAMLVSIPLLLASGKKRERVQEAVFARERMLGLKKNRDLVGIQREQMILLTETRAVL